MKLFLTGLLVLTKLLGQAKTPTVITDLQGREVTVNLPVEKLFLVDSRDICQWILLRVKWDISYCGLE